MLQIWPIYKCFYIIRAPLTRFRSDRMAEQEHSPSHLSNPHDRFFRHFLADQKRARAFLHHVLPPPVLAHLDLTRVT